METESGISSLLRGNIVPLVLALAGIIFIGLGIFVFSQQRSSQDQLQFQAGNSQESSSSSAKLVIDIEGGVINPGIYKLPEGSRVHDLLVASGGLSNEADRTWFQKSINQASKLQDGQKIYIIRNGEDIGTSVATGLSTDGSSSSTSLLTNINSASLTDLDNLPGIGPVTAQKIVDNRPYISLDELVSKKAVSSSVFGKIKDKISIN